jgi:TolB-like protein/DNA-binding winged helix-turn-helix (wHTH) protein
MTTLSAPRRVKFGDFVADFDSFELRKHGIRLKLQDQPFQILKLLLQRPGQLVTREELRIELWTESTFVDFDAGLNAAIRRLRDALNESAEEPRYIETLPRHGYRFIASVEIEPESLAITCEKPQTKHVARGQEAAAPLLEPSVPQEKQTKSPRMLLPGSLVAGCLLLAAVGMGAVALHSKLFAKHSVGGHINSIAVLPLQNLSGDPSQDYFADGMTDALITDLAQIKQLHVISRTSTMRFKGTQKKVPEIAKELGVDAVLEGAAVRSGDRVRIDAQLIRGDNDVHLWAKSYDRNINDILSLQSDLARAIASEIAVTLTSAEQAHLGKSAQTVNPQAYEAYLKGLYFFELGEDTDLEKAIGYYEKSVHLDPNYAPANLGLGQAYGMLAFLEAGTIPPAEAWLKSEKYLARALELDPDSSLAHTLLGMDKLVHQCDRAGAEKELNLALTLNPNDMTSLDYHSYYLLLIGQQEQAIAEKRRVLENDPLAFGTRSELGMYFTTAGRVDDAIEQYQYTLQLDPNSGMTYERLGMLYHDKGQYEEAVVQLKKALAFERRPRWLGNLGLVYAKWGKTNESLGVVAELKGMSRQHQVSPSQIARIYAALGDKDQAIAWLDKAKKGDFPPPSDREFMDLRSDPRFAAIEARVKADPGCTY